MENATLFTMNNAVHHLRIPTFILTLLLGIAFSTPLALANNTLITTANFSDATERALSYSSISTDGNPIFDFDGAIANHESTEVLAVGREFLLVGESYSSHQNELRAVSFPVWGNWCGPNHGSGKPIDILDELCMHHDKCYAARGYFDCLCDRQLKDGIQREKGKMTPEARKRAAGIYVWFSTFICVPH